MSGRITGGQPETFAREAKIYHVNVDPDPTAGQVDGEVIVSTCEDFMADLKGWPEFPFTEWLDQCVAWKNQYDPVKPEMLEGDLHHYGFIRRLSEQLPNDAIVVSDTGGNVIMMGHAFKSKRGQRIFTSNGNTPMGFAMCGAIGAWFAEPSRPVICIIGDGGMSMNIQELQTLVNYGVNIKVFIINNSILGNTASFQRVNGMKHVACSAPDYSPPDFAKLTMAYGLVSFHVAAWNHLETIVNMMLETDAPCICNVPHDDFCQYEPRLSVWEGGIEEMYPPLPKEEFLSNMIIDPINGWDKRAKEMK
jgi:acetolactate synthase-1/2/3 large subunit